MVTKNYSADSIEVLEGLDPRQEAPGHVHGHHQAQSSGAGSHRQQR